MQLGLNIGTHDPSGDETHWDVTRRIAQNAEAAGFDSVWMKDHFMFRDREHPEKDQLSATNGAGNRP